MNSNSGDDIPFAYVDGSYNVKTGVFGYGGFIDDGKTRYYLIGSDTDVEKAKSRNISGEVAGSMAVIKKAEELGLKSITIYYDYAGVEKWATGEWGIKSKPAKEYYEFLNSPDRKVRPKFVKVEAHTGILGNEIADVLAKYAVGVDLTRKQNKLLEKVLNEMEDIKMSINTYTFDEAIDNLNEYQEKYHLPEAFADGEVTPWNIGFINHDGREDEVQLDAASADELRELWIDLHEEFDTEVDNILYIEEGIDDDFSISRDDRVAKAEAVLDEVDDEVPFEEIKEH